MNLQKFSWRQESGFVDLIVFDVFEFGELIGQRRSLFVVTDRNLEGNGKPVASLNA